MTIYRFDVSRSEPGSQFVQFDVVCPSSAMSNMRPGLVNCLLHVDVSSVRPCPPRSAPRGRISAAWRMTSARKSAPTPTSPRSGEKRLETTRCDAR